MVIKAELSGSKLVTENSSQAKALSTQSSYGSLRSDSCVELSLFEALFLVEQRKLTVIDKNGKKVSKRALERKALTTKKAHVRYAVFSDMRKRGYVVKTALKFGADFRVYERGVKPGKDHAKWVLFAAHESDRLTWHAFAAQNRVAHSTKKKLLVGVVDDEGDVSYWEAHWRRP